MAKGDYDSPVSVTIAARTELQWWVGNVTTASNDITPSDPDITVKENSTLRKEEPVPSGMWLCAPTTPSHPLRVNSAADNKPSAEKWQRRKVAVPGVLQITVQIHGKKDGECFDFPKTSRGKSELL